MSVLIALAIPGQAVTIIRDAMRSYQDVLSTSIPQEQWVCELLLIGDAPLNSEQLIILSQPIRQSFHPVINILSLGAGKDTNQLWAYIQDQSFLHDIREEIIERVKECDILIDETAFVPHIHVGNLEETTSTLSVPDTPVKTKFSLSELVIRQDYAVIGTIPVTS